MKTYRQKTGLRDQRMGDETMVFDADGDRVHVLNTTSGFIWRCLAEPCTRAELSEKVETEFDTSTVDDLSALVGRALDQLSEKGLIEEGPAAP
jgi:hypothetical protein